MSQEENRSSRRRFLTGLGGLGVFALSKSAVAAELRFFQPTLVDNPLSFYPDRDWEKSYRNIFAHDSQFHFLCSPNDTHNCLLRSYVKNGIITRIGPSFGYGKAKDSYGNSASARWDPRICQKGLGLVRRIYGNRRIKSPMIRKGFKDWVDAGFPRDSSTLAPDAKYFQRGRDSWLRLSWDEAYRYSAKAFENISKCYSGERGAKALKSQNYDEAMIEALEGAGTQTIKLRGGMAFLGMTRIYGLYRFGNMLALLDDYNRKVGPEYALGARGWDSYSWHTDLPPGHPMVTGMQTNDFDLFATEKAKLVIAWGMNWITTKMPDSHWLTEARIKGTKVAAVTVEYSATASKADEVIIIRPGTDPAFALGLAQIIISKKLFDADFVARNTDLPLLIRMDTLEPLRPEDIDLNYKYTVPENLTVIGTNEKPPQSKSQRGQSTSESMTDEFRPSCAWDKSKKKVLVVSRNDWGKHFAGKVDLRARKKVKLSGGEVVEVRTVFSLVEEYLNSNFTPKLTSKVTGTPVSGIISLAVQIANAREGTLFATGMGPNQFFNADLKDRAIFLVAALTRNVGFHGGNVGAYAGNYRISIFDGAPYYAAEDPYHLALDADAPVRQKKYSHYESLHYYNYGDRPLRVGSKLFTGKSHLPTPTKAMWLNNSNSVIGNVKWHYDVVNNTLPKIEFIAFSDWWWTGSCEYADLVFACDSWAEFKHPDMTGSCTNPFVQIHPVTPIERIFDTRSDIEIIAGVSAALGKLTGDKRMFDMWKFVHDNKVQVYLQRIIDNSCSLKGYKIENLEELAKKGIPALINARTYPRISSYEQVRGEQPWHTKTGRLEFYRHEQEFIEHGENLPVHREPVDSTPYEPNVIVAKPHPAIRPVGPEAYGLTKDDLSTETRQIRNVMMTPDQVVKSKHPLRAKQFKHVYHTPKYRHGVHSTPVDTDFVSVWFGPFGDVYRHDKRMPSVTEGYVDLNPLDAKEIGVEDGDYVWIDADPTDRPFRGFKEGTEEYKVARLLLRVRYYPGTPLGIARTWHNMYGATFGSVKGQESNKDGLARNPITGYQSMYRYGSHQSATRAWLRPTLMTESLVRKDMFGQNIGKGFAADIHCVTGAPRESFVKITKAEAGGLNGQGMWRPAALGFRPTYENQAMKAYLKGQFVKSGRT